jgi:hypothetical protein
MRLHAKVVVATRQRPATVWASTSAASARPGAMLLKFTTNEDRQAMLRGCKGLAGTKLGLDEDLTPVQQARKLELWPLFKEAKAAGKHALLACSQALHQRHSNLLALLYVSVWGPERPMCGIMEHAWGWCK